MGTNQSTHATAAPTPTALPSAVAETTPKVGLVVPSAPMLEDGSAAIAQMQLPSYSEKSELSGINNYIRDLITVGQQNKFEVTISGDREVVAEQIKNDLVAQDGFSAADAEAVVTSTLLVTPGPVAETPFVEDTKILTQGGEVLKPRAITNQTLERIKSYLDPLADAAVGTFGHSFANEVDANGLDTVSISGEIAANPSFAAEADVYAADHRLAIRQATSYVEGGNALFGKHRDGRNYAIIGQDSAVFTAFALRDDESISKSQQQQKLNQLQQLPKADLAERVEDAKQRLARSEKDPSDKQALRLLADIEVAKDVIAKDLSIARSDVTFVTQPDYHIDMHMLPLSPGKVLVHSHQATAEMLEAAIKNIAPNTKEHGLLENMISVSKEKSQTLDPINSKVVRELEAAGFEVVKAPGVAFGTVDNKEVRFNFLNAVPATSDKTYLITNSPGIAEVENEFENFIKSHGIKEVHWVGSPRGEEDFTQAASNRLLSLSAGLSCIQTAKNE